MSMFWCAQCDEMRDSDDGCDEAPNSRPSCFDLICVECMEANEIETEVLRYEDRRGI